ncbi:MAG: UbiX family flavin prenyltransferase [Ignavibacteriales bacterium]
MRIIVGITGASGAVYGIRILEELAAAGIETHLVVSEWGKETIRHETGLRVEHVANLASVMYDNDDLGASVSSGSFVTSGMVIAPCSMKTVSAIANGYSDGLISRAAGVCLKEGRRLVIVPRESPLSAIHLENMLRLARLQVAVIPPMVGFYSKPTSVDEVVDQTVGRVLDHLGVEHNLVRRWDGLTRECRLSERNDVGRCGPEPRVSGPSGSGRESPGEFFEVSVGSGRMKVWGRVWRMHGGLVVGLFGGESPHVGSVVLSIPRASLSDPKMVSSTSSVINLPSHKEEEVVRPVAEGLTRTTGVPVVCIGGVHIDRCSSAEVAELVANCREVGRLVSDRLGRCGGITGDSKGSAG